MPFISKRAACSTLMVLTSFAASHAFAGSQGQGPSLKDKDLVPTGPSYVFSISAGPVWAVNLKNQSFYLEPELKIMLCFDFGRKSPKGQLPVGFKPSTFGTRKHCRFLYQKAVKQVSVRKKGTLSHQQILINTYFMLFYTK